MAQPLRRQVIFLNIAILVHVFAVIVVWVVFVGAISTFSFGHYLGSAAQGVCLLVILVLLSRVYGPRERQ